MWKFVKKKQLNKLPKVAGVYCFKGEANKGAKLLYIGKAVNIRERVKNHFFSEAKKIGYIKTNSEIEALILESRLIKMRKPKFNIVWRDDKNYFYVGITNEDLPRIFITHQPNTKYKIQDTRYIGPFTEGKPLKKVLKFLRRVFPYYVQKKHPRLNCGWCHLDLCPGPDPDKKEYKNNIKKLISVLRGESNSVMKSLKREMLEASKKENFEKAAKIRGQIQSLENVLAHAKVLELPPNSLPRRSYWYRVEGYDVSNIQGQQATASMVTFINGEPYKKLYRKFKIKISGKPNDVAMIKETLKRRFKHSEWGHPNVILIDGGKAQLNAALAILNKKKSAKSAPISVMALAKKRNELFIEGKKKPILLENQSREFSNLILHIRDEAHRFAKKYHLKLRSKALLDSRG